MIIRVVKFAPVLMNVWIVPCDGLHPIHGLFSPNKDIYVQCSQDLLQLSMMILLSPKISGTAPNIADTRQNFQ